MAPNSRKSPKLPCIHRLKLTARYPEGPALENVSALKYGHFSYLTKSMLDCQISRVYHFSIITGKFSLLHDEDDNGDDGDEHHKLENYGVRFTHSLSRFLIKSQMPQLVFCKPLFITD